MVIYLCLCLRPPRQLRCRHACVRSRLTMPSERIGIVAIEHEREMHSSRIWRLDLSAWRCVRQVSQRGEQTHVSEGIVRRERWQARFMARRLVGQSDPKWSVANLPCRLADLPCLPTSLGSGAALLVCPFACLSFATSRRDWENYWRADDDHPWFHRSTTKRVSQVESKTVSKSERQGRQSLVHITNISCLRLKS